jgi:diguanylate cyclase (GGDEF)-like protein
MLQSGRQGPEFYAALWQSVTDKGHWYGEIWNRRKSGEVYAEMLTISTVRDASGRAEHYVALFSDITAIKEHQKQLEHIAHFDALTQLPNRVLLADRLHQAIIHCQRRAMSLAVVFLDLDGFKLVNDRFGHACGDTLLVEVAQRMKAALREGDTLARMGGDEFVAILVDLEQAHDCEQVLARMLAAASDPLMVDGTSLRLSASMGVTLFPQDGTEADMLMRQADQAMYAAKQAGKNRFHLFDFAQDAAIKSKREGIGRIRHALENHEFVLYYQPKVNMRSGQVVGAEALIRWQHPELGLLAPAQFLPVIEDHPLSITMGEWVIATALDQLVAWGIANPDFSISVNIGARQLQDANFCQSIQQHLRAHGDVAPKRLQLEILETNALQDVDKVGAVITACQDLGVSFALDDFGTGYSSLTYLKHLHAETLKIDQSFVRDMLLDASDLAIVNGVIGLAKAFGREVIAEGVETAAHRDLLLSIDCELAQGYGIAKPMPAADFPAWMERWHSQPVWQA